MQRQREKNLHVKTQNLRTLFFNYQGIFRRDNVL
jgi:hypothetical protein